MNRDFVEMLSALSETGVEFLVVGAHAVAVHARPRATGDLDLWVRPTPENAARVVTALARFGAPMHDITGGDFEAPNLILNKRATARPQDRADLEALGDPL
jgi:hypothetical protein